MQIVVCIIRLIVITKDNAYYGPVPYDQILNFPSLIQNAGW